MRLDGHKQKDALPSHLQRQTAVALIAYGALGVAINLRLLPLAAGGITSWLGLPAAVSAPTRWGMLSFVEAHFDGLPWLPWAAWLVGLALLAGRVRAGNGKEHNTGSVPSK